MRLAMVARWRPVHRVHASVLRGLRSAATDLVIGIGSANRYDRDNPFTADEAEAMIRAVVPDVAIERFDDLGDGPRWAEAVRDRLGPVDAFVTANPWTRELLAPTWRILHPVSFVPPAERSRLEGRDVRLAMARGEGWRDLVPPEVAAILEERSLVARFRREFGLEVLSRLGPGDDSRR